MCTCIGIYVYLSDTYMWLVSVQLMHGVEASIPLDTTYAGLVEVIKFRIFFPDSKSSSINLKCSSLIFKCLPSNPNLLSSPKSS